MADAGQADVGAALSAAGMSRPPLVSAHSFVLFAWLAGAYPSHSATLLGLGVLNFFAGCALSLLNLVIAC
jgi:hypothetical protein